MFSKNVEVALKRVAVLEYIGLLRIELSQDTYLIRLGKRHRGRKRHTGRRKLPQNTRPNHEKSAFVNGGARFVSGNR